MKEHSYFSFSLNNCIYGISAVYVEETFPLPELTLIATASRDIVGVVHLPGEILPVLVLNLIRDYQSSDYRLTDSVVVLRWEKLRVGIIVNKVYELRNIAPEEINIELPLEREWAGVEHNKIITGIVRGAEDILILSSPENLFGHLEIQQIISVKDSLEKIIQDSHNGEDLQPNDSELLLAQQPVFCPNAIPEERAIFRQRAEHLKQSAQRQSLMPIAIIALNGNLFGIDLKMVQEFTEIRKVTPIPCCPAHIIGNMNLRGEILTLIDIRGLLNLPLTGMPNSFKAMVVEVEGIIAGIIVEQVYDVMFFLNPLEIMAVPTAHSINFEYLQGITPYAEQMISILDLLKILINGGLSVNETV